MPPTFLFLLSSLVKEPTVLQKTVKPKKIPYTKKRKLKTKKVKKIAAYMVKA